MARGHFDLDKVRKNWERTSTPPADQLPERLARVRAPRDPFPEARGLLARIRALAAAQMPERAAALAPFFADAEALVERMERRRAEADAGEGPELDELRAAFQRVLDDLGDLFEVFSGVNR